MPIDLTPPGGSLGGGINLTPAAAGSTPDAPGSEGGLDKLLSFGLSTIESVPEMFGLAPSPETQNYRANNPIGGFVSGALGTLVPYVGEAKLLRMVPTIGAGIDAAKAIGLAKGPALGAALELGSEAGAVGALNTAIAATPVPGAIYKATTGQDPTEEPIGDVALGNAFNTLGAGALGGGFGLLAKRFDFGTKLADIVPGFNTSDPPVVQLRTINDALAAHADPADPFKFSTDPGINGQSDLDRVQKASSILTKFNLLDKVPDFTSTGDPINVDNARWADQGPLYRGLVGETKSRPVGAWLNRVAEPRSNPDNVLQSQYLVQDSLGGFHSEQELQNVTDLAGVTGQQLAQDAQNARVFTIKDGTGYQPMPPATAAVGEGVNFDLSDLASGEDVSHAINFDETAAPEPPPTRRLLSSEPQYLDEPTPGQAAKMSGAQKVATTFQRRFTGAPFKDVGDGWRMARDTDNMYVFNKKLVGDISRASPGDSWITFRTDKPEVFAPRAARSDNVIMRSAFFPSRQELLTTGERLFDAGNAYRDMFGGDAILAKASKVRGKVSAVVRDSLATAATKVAPSGPLFEKNPIANYAWQMVKALEHHAELGVSAVMNGKIKINPGTPLWKVILNPDHELGLHAGFRTLDSNDLADVKSIIGAEVPFDEATELHAQGHISDKAHAVLTALQSLSDNFEDRYNKVSLGVRGNDAMNLLATFDAKMGHYMISRQYPGAYKVLLHDENNELVGWGTGKSPLEANQDALATIADEAKAGRTVTPGGMIDSAVMNPELANQMRSAVMKPGFLRSRGNLIGNELGRGDLTVKKLGELVEKNLRTRENYLRDIAILEHTAEPLAALRRDDPQLAEAFVNAMGKLRGEQTKWDAFQNNVVDTTLHAVGLSGKDSATNIVRVGQKLMSAFQFGFNLSQPIQNMVGMMQTILPEIAYVLHADPLTLSRNYVSMPLIADGSVKGVLGQLSTTKLMKNSFDYFMKPMGQQSAAYQEYMGDLINRRIINGRITEEQFGSDGYILGHMGAAFKQGHNITDVMKAGSTILMTKSEEINRTMAANVAWEIGTMRGFDAQRMRLFAQEFIHKTQYSYATHDRSAVFTTPLGSLGGTFKNWMFHYLGSMIKYSGAGPAGMKALAWQTAVTGLVGGAAAMPVMVPMANAASGFFANKSAMQELYDTAANLGLPENVADGLMYGLPGSLGVSLSSQVASPASDPIRDASMLWDFAAFDRMKALSKGTQDALLAYKTLGQNPFQNDLVRDELGRALAPRVIYRAMALGQQGAIRSMSTGYDVAKLGLGGAAMYTAGFNPTELDKAYQVYSEVREDQAAKKAMVQEFGEGLAQAWENKDDNLANRIYTRAMATGVDMSSVLRSAQSRQLRQQQTQLNYSASPQDKQDYSFEFNDGSGQQ